MAFETLQAEYGNMLSCVRCHRAGVVGESAPTETLAGPHLAGIGAKQSREYLLESIITPNKDIAQGFETVALQVKTDRPGRFKYYTGILKKETDAEIHVEVPERGLIPVPKADLVARERGPSAMPDEVAKPLTRRDLRDLVEFLSSLKDQPHQR